MAIRHDTSHAVERGGAEGADRAALEAAYHADIGRVLRRRLVLIVGLFLAFVGVAVAAERAAYPDRAPFIGAIYLAEVAVALLALVACRARRVRERPGLVAAALATPPSAP
jgi:hypothetical protein